MDKNAYSEMKFNQENHWWYRARRIILEDMVSQIVSAPPQRILEIGCGTGGNIQFLSCYGSLTAIDFEEIAIESCRTNPMFNSSKTQFIRMNVEDAGLYFSDESFDLICMFDVLEHLENDREILSKLSRLLPSTGYICVTVPAYNWLWSTHDVYLHHKRRYTKSRLAKLASECSYVVTKSGYFNSLLFPLAVVERIISRLKPSRASEIVSVPNRLINEALFQIFKFERNLMPLVPFPFGLSVWAILEKSKLKE